MENIDYRILLNQQKNNINKLMVKNQPITGYFLSLDQLCDKDIKVICSLGQGTQGRVCLINFKGDIKPYVQKLFFSGDYNFSLNDRIKISNIFQDDTIKIRDFIERSLIEIGLDQRIDPVAIIKYNNLNPDNVIRISNINNINIPISMVECRVNSDKIKYIQGSIVNIEAGDYVCLSNIYTEFLNSLLASKLLETQQSIHFIHTFGITSCSNDNMQPTQSIILEHLDSDLKKFLTDLDIGLYTQQFDIVDLDVIVFGVIHSIYMLVNKYSMVHNDIHLANIGLINSHRVRYGFDNRLISSYDFVSYGVGDDQYYFNVPNYIIKIVDFGYAQSFSKPKILQYQLIDEQIESIPGYNSQGYYDLFLFFYALDYHDKLVGCALKAFLYLFNNLNDLNNVNSDANNDPFLIFDTFSYPRSPGRFNPYKLSQLLPYLPKLDENFFREVFGDYLHQPDNNNIINLASI